MNSMNDKKEYKILIVDDYDLDRMIFIRFLAGDKEMKYQFLEAESAKDAVQILDSTPIDCLITDYNLLGETGLTLMDKLRNESRKTVPVMVSGTSDEKVLKLISNREFLFFQKDHLDRQDFLTKIKTRLLAS
ncbi:MAG: response regulator [Bdellovibrionia bacterium]